jgi:hypothetical protein
MSHFTRVRTKLQDVQTLRRALEDLGYNVETNGAVRGYGGNVTPADLVVRTDADYDIGFRRTGESVVMVADFWGLRIDRTRFLNEITQRYAYLTVLEQAGAGGWQAVEEEVQADGSIRLVMQHWG